MSARAKTSLNGIARSLAADRSRIREIWLPSFMALLVSVDYRFRPMEGMPSFTLAEVSSYAVALLYFGHGSVQGVSWRDFSRGIYRENRPVYWYFGWVALSAVVGLARSENVLPVVKDIIPSLIIFTLVLRCVRTEEHLLSVLSCFLLGVAVNGVLGVVQTMTNGYYIGEMHDITFLKTDRYGAIVDHLAMGFFSHPNGYALFLIPAILLAFFLVRHRAVAGRHPDVRLLLLLALLGYNLYHTFSKGALAWTAIGVLLLIALPRLNRRWFFLCCGISVAGGIAAIVGAGAWLFVHYSGAFGTTLGRLAYWREGIDVLLSDRAIFFFGSGFDDIEAVMRARFGIPMNHAHNGYLNQALFHGVPAMLFFIWVVAGNLWKVADRGGRRGPADPGLAGLRSFLGACHVAYFGEYFFEPAQLGVNGQALAFLLFAITTVFSREDFPPQEVAGA
jgi:hypothetical protein